MENSDSADELLKWEPITPEMHKPLKLPSRQGTVVAAEVKESRGWVLGGNPISETISFSRCLTSGQLSVEKDREKHVDEESGLDAIPKQPRRRASIICLHCSLENSIVPPQFPQRRESLVIGHNNGRTDESPVAHHSNSIVHDKRPTFPHRRCSIEAPACNATLLDGPFVADDVSILTEDDAMWDNNGMSGQNISPMVAGSPARIIPYNDIKEFDQEWDRTIYNESGLDFFQDKQPNYPRRRGSSACIGAEDCCQSCLNAHVLVSNSDRLLLSEPPVSGRAQSTRAMCAPPMFPLRRVSDAPNNKETPPNITAEVNLLDSLVPLMWYKRSCNDVHCCGKSRPRCQSHPSQRSLGSREERSNCSSIARAA